MLSFDIEYPGQARARVAEDHGGTDHIGPRVPPRRLAEPEYAAASRRRTARVVRLGIVVLILAFAVIGIVGRDGILSMWPSTAGVYRSSGLAEAPGAGLKVTVTATRSGGGLIVGGEIVNSGGEAKQVPRLRVAVRDGHGSEVDVRLLDPPVARLAPGATARFETIFEHPVMTATGAAATFAP